MWTRFASMGKVAVSLEASTPPLASTEPVRSLCRLQRRLEGLPGYASSCSLPSLRADSDRDLLTSACCPVWSLPNFITSIVGRSSCEEVITICYTFPYLHI